MSQAVLSFYSFAQSSQRYVTVSYLTDCLGLCKSFNKLNLLVFGGFPNTFVQAWLRETPVISLNVDPGGVIERENIGVYCHGDFEVMKAVVRELLNDDQKRLEMGKRARAYAEKAHGYESNRQTYDRFFRAVVEGKPIDTMDMNTLDEKTTPVRH